MKRLSLAIFAGALAWGSMTVAYGQSARPYTYTSRPPVQQQRTTYTPSARPYTYTSRPPVQQQWPASGDSTRPTTYSYRPPFPQQTTAHTTPMYNNPRPLPNFFPQARQIGVPTANAPNTLPWLRPPPYPQARQVPACAMSSPPAC